MSPIPFATPTPATSENSDATPTATLANTPEPTPSPLAAEAQTTAVVSISPSPAPDGQGTISVASFAISVIAGAVLTSVISLAIAKRIGKRARAKKTAHLRGGVLPQGLEVGNAHNIGKRSNQEDSFGISDLNNQRLVRDSGVLAVVADGVGGLSDGELVSAAAVGAMMREFPMISNNWMPHQKLLYLAQRANDAANEVTGGARNQGGSTLLATIVRDGRLWFTSVGDSRICLCRGGGLVTLTRPHVYETDLDRRAASGAISFEAALADGQRGALTSYVGKGELEALDYNPRGIQLLAGDWVLLMTDGVFNALDEEEIAASLYGNAQHAAERIESRVIAKGLPHQDNLTLVALRLI